MYNFLQVKGYQGIARRRTCVSRKNDPDLSRQGVIDADLSRTWGGIAEYAIYVQKLIISISNRPVNTK